MKFTYVYHLLTSYGHSAAKAGEIILDARRGDKVARRWIGIIAHFRHQMFRAVPL